MRFTNAPSAYDYGGTIDLTGLADAITEQAKARALQIDPNMEYLLYRSPGCRLVAIQDEDRFQADRYLSGSYWVTSPLGTLEVSS